jgi:hypothetical protein
MIYLPIKLEEMTQSTFAPMMPSASRHGFFLGFSLVVKQTIFYLADINSQSILGVLLFLILLCGGLFLSARQYRDELNNGFISYGRLVGYSVVVSLMAGIISSTFVFVLNQYIDITLIEKLLYETETTLDKMNRPPEETEMAMKFYEFVYTPFGLSIITILRCVVNGTIFSLVVAVFLKKEDEGFNSFNKDTI